jgi:Trk K+ transport system NAD-binding subunit
MVYEGMDFSWITGFYWTLTVMSTLGFGDITFTTDLGLLFTLLVLMSGIILLLIMLPFTFIQFFYAPYLEAQEHSRTPRFLPKTMRDHVILTNFDPLTRSLVAKLKKYHYDYTFITGDQREALEIYDAGYKVVVGDVDRPETYELVQVQQAAMVVATADDLMNTNVSFTVREVCETVPIVCSADKEHSLDILNFSGNTHVFQFLKMLGGNLAARTIGVAEANVIGRFEELLIAEFPVYDTVLAGQALAGVENLHELRVSIIGFLKRGQVTMPDPHELLSQTTILILAGTEENITQVGRKLAVSCVFPPPEPAVIILGGGRVGRAAAAFLEQSSVSYRIVEKSEDVRGQDSLYIHGDAANIDVLKQAGIEQARSVIVTTHDDAMNIYLSFYCRQLRPDIQVIARASKESTRSKLYRAGADQVGSAAVRGAGTIMDLIHPHEDSLYSTDLVFFRALVPGALAGKSLIESRLRAKTGCTVMAIRDGESFLSNPDPEMLLPHTGELILAGSLKAENMFQKEYLN